MELNTLLKIKGVAPTGGQAKLLIRSGAVRVNGEVETRNRRQLCEGDVVNVTRQEFVVQ